MSENKHTLEPVALTHAAWLEKSLTIGAREAASELRRLHEVEKQRDELLAALHGVSTRLRRAGASIPAPENKGTIESVMDTGLSIALVLVDDAIASVKGQK